MPLPDATRMGRVEIAVRDLDLAVRFYRDLLGMRQHAINAREALLGADQPLLRLISAPDATPRVRGQAGLYHVAYLMPSRAELGRAIAHLVRARWPLQGASDHEVSEALYLADPEGNGIEIYADRPRSQWPKPGELGWAGGPQPMDVESVLAEAGDIPWSGFPTGATVGHVHLHVSDVPKADAFYQETIGFERQMELGGTASFLSAGGYHHHVAVNNWGTRGGPPNSADALGLRSLSIVVPDGEAREDLVKRLGDSTTVDPSGNKIVIDRS